MASDLQYVSGLKELDAILKSLPAKVEFGVMRGALRAGQTVILKAAKNALIAQGSVDSGALLKSLRITTPMRTRKTRSGRKAMREKKAGLVRVNLIAGNKEAWYSHLVEYGTASYYTGQGRTVGKPYKIKPKKQGGGLLFGGKVREEVTHPGIRPRSFMRSAFDSSSKAAIDATVAYIRRRLPKEVAKAGA